MLRNSSKTHVCEQLKVVCIEVMAYVEAVNHIRHVLCIDCELLWTDSLALRNTTHQTDWTRAAIWHLECLRVSGVKGSGFDSHRCRNILFCALWFYSAQRKQVSAFAGEVLHSWLEL